MSLNDTYILVQARMRSTRLPGKVLKTIYQLSLLENVIWNLPLDRLVVLTSDEREDDVLADFCGKNSIEVFRGPQENVFERFQRAIKIYNSTYYIRLTADNPCLYKDAFSPMIQLLKNEKLDYCVGQELPLGGAAEAFTRQSFLEQSKEPLSSSQIEHVTAKYYAVDSKYHWKHFPCGYNHLRRMRLTIDTAEDLKMFQHIVQLVKKDPCQLHYGQLEKIYQNHKEIVELNRGIAQRTVYDTNPETNP